MKVLIVDDNPDLARSSALLLGLDGHDARTAETGAEAVAAAADFRPDVVLIDLRLPDLDGREVARRLRAGLGAAPLLFAVSGLDPEDRPPVEPGLFDRQLVKPIDLSALGRLVGDDRRHPSGGG